MTLVLTLAGTYLLATLAAILTVALISRGRGRAPEGAIIAYGMIFFILWVAIFLALGVWKRLG